MRVHLSLFIVTVGLFAAATARAQSDTSVRRFALVVGANDGGPERTTLRYASADARSFATVMAEMGGLAESDTLLLVDPDRDGLENAFAQLDTQIREAEQDHSRLEFFFYYSGHSDEVGLLVSDGRVDYQQVRTLVNSIDTDVRIGIFDSCASGAFTLLKGGEWQPAFLVDASNDVRGHAYLTSSSADEVAQESETIQASFFTYYLVSGLRGAADTSGDRRVTLNEAYRFAFDETLARTESTRGGPQHPAYDIGLVGTGDIVLTDLNETSATLAIVEELHGRFFVRDASGLLVAELFKPSGRRIELGLAPGTYDVRLDTGEALFSARVELREDDTTVLDTDRLIAQEVEGTMARGDRIGVTEEHEVPLTGHQDYRHLPLAMALVTPIDSNSVEAERPVLNNLAINWIYGESGRVDGLQLTMAGQSVDDRLRGLQVAGAFNRAGGPVEGLQASGAVNLLDGDLHGLQAAGAFNLGGGRIMGAQASGAVNLASGEIYGLQAAGALNQTPASLAGVQVSGGINVTGRSLTGIQVAGGLNYADQVAGAQVGTINVCGDIDGAQVGVINVARRNVDGVQIGVINYADEADASIGVIGGTRAGGYHPQVWTSDTAVVSTGLRADANYTYTLLTAGSYPFLDEAAWLFGVGLGVKLFRVIPSLGIELDLTHHAVMFEHDFSEGYVGLSVARLLARWQVTPGFSLFAGPALDVYVGQGANRLRERPGYIEEVGTYHPEEDIRVEIWPGFSAGISLL